MSTLTEIEQQSTRLSATERAELALFLLNSLSAVDEGNAQDAWRREAQARLAQIRPGTGTQANETSGQNTQNWSLDHADFISAYNRTIEAEGLALDEWRNF